MPIETKTEPRAPSEELDVNGLDAEGAVGEAMETLQRRPTHDAKGRFCRDTQAAAGARWPARSETFWRAVAEAKAELIARVRSDLGADDGSSAETLLGLADGYAEARLLRLGAAAEAALA